MDQVNHENASATQAIAVAVGTAVHLFAPQYDGAVLPIVAGIFALLGVLKPFLPEKIRGTF